ncbi:MAG: SDR family oxidoreductase [Aliishimia sp.]
MNFSNKIIAITGGGSGIGAALAYKVAKLGARVIIADRNHDAAQSVAAQTDGLALACDVSEETNIQTMISEAESQIGPIDIFVSNAGLGRGDPSHAASAPDEDWMLNWNVHVMAHVWAARALLPGMIERGHGYFVNVASAAGLLNQIGDAAYSATKHAAVSFAESISIAHGKDGIGVSVVCPQYVATPLIGLSEEDAKTRESLMTAADVADVVLLGISENRFLVLPHPQVADYTKLRGEDHGQWITGMQLLRAKAIATYGKASAEELYKMI